MKKNLFTATALFVVLALTGCGKKENSNVIKVGATPEPHAEMLKLVVDDFFDSPIVLLCLLVELAF